MSFESPYNYGPHQDLLVQAKATLNQNPQDLIAVVDKCVIGVCITDQNANFIHVNEAYCQIYGYRYDELIGQNFTIMAPSQDRHAVWQAIHDAFIEDGQEMGGEWVVMAKDGRLLTIYTDAVRIGHPDRGGYQKVTFVNDITDLRTVQRDLADLRKRFAALIEQPFYPVAVLEASSGQILLANKAFVDHSGTTADAVQDGRIADFYLPVAISWDELIEKVDTEEEGILQTLKTVRGAQKEHQAHLRAFTESGRREVLLTLKA